MDEIAALTPRLRRRRPTSGSAAAGLQWPVAPDGTDAPILYERRVRRCPAARRSSRRCPYKAPGDAADEEFPLILVTGRRLQHYNAGTMTRRTGNLELIDRDVLEIHPDDAERLWIADGDIVSVRSRDGPDRDRPRRSPTGSSRGHVFTTFHFPETRTNLLIGQSADVNTSCPEYKVIAVDVRPIGEEPRACPRSPPATEPDAHGRAHGAVVERDGTRDEVAVEEPLEIRVDGAPLAVTMRTPGHDEELALGFLLRRGADRRAARRAGLTEDFAANTIEVAGPLLRDPGARRFYTTSSCGVCGKGALEEVAVHAPRAPARPGDRRARCSPRCPTACASRRSRAPAACTRPACSRADGELLLVREDVGRHNAMDKVIGRALLDGLLPLHDRVLCVSGRLSFELVQKAAVAGAPILVGVGRADVARDRAGRRPRA